MIHRQPTDQFKEAKRRVSRRGPLALILMLLPGILLPVGLLLARNDPRFAWISHPTQYPWELWAIATFGIVASIGGLGDWFFHRSGETAVGAAEHRAHVLALGMGCLPLFLLMSAASIATRPLAWLLPVIAVLIVTVILICYDEFLFHCRCGRLEQALHRMLTIGNALAWFAWAHWCFVREYAYA
ncbi:MAG TPA: hypothetical protein VHS31_16530 [Tepidisphaeraceae bacterium]|jgi:hypothetical protein|nr:hypothetical protein [Tepidisphaeraceae bacterium]